MVIKNKISTDTVVAPEYIDCACLIHDVLYSWDYVEKLYHALCRNLTPKVRLHVYTESSREVPAEFQRHDLIEWPNIRGPKRSWWYKIQLFNSQHHRGHMLYLDLDTVICGNLDWIWQLPKTAFWAARDFKYLFRPNKFAINSSVMWFNPAEYHYIYDQFNPQDVVDRKKAWHGDQDYIMEKIPPSNLGYLDHTRIRSWRWELLDGGFDFKKRSHVKPGLGTTILDGTSIMVFHGNPKPHELQDPAILQHWI